MEFCVRQPSHYLHLGYDKNRFGFGFWPNFGHFGRILVLLKLTKWLFRLVSVSAEIKKVFRLYPISIQVDILQLLLTPHVPMSKKFTYICILFESFKNSLISTIAVFPMHTTYIANCPSESVNPISQAITFSIGSRFFQA